MKYSKVDMSKCMVAFIDWYHERFDGEGGREKIKVKTKYKDKWRLKYKDR